MYQDIEPDLNGYTITMSAYYLRFFLNSVPLFGVIEAGVSVRVPAHDLRGKRFVKGKQYIVCYGSISGYALPKQSKIQTIQIKYGRINRGDLFSDHRDNKPFILS